MRDPIRLVPRAGGRLLRRLAPGTMSALDHVRVLQQREGEVGSHLPDLLSAVAELRERLRILEDRIEVLEDAPAAIDEIRRDSLRVAELTDVVVATLASLPQSRIS